MAPVAVTLLLFRQSCNNLPYPKKCVAIVTQNTIVTADSAVAMTIELEARASAVRNFVAMRYEFTPAGSAADTTAILAVNGGRPMASASPSTTAGMTKSLIVAMTSDAARWRYTCLDRTIKEALPDYDMSAVFW